MYVLINSAAFQFFFVQMILKEKTRDKMIKTINDK